LQDPVHRTFPEQSAATLTDVKVIAALLAVLALAIPSVALAASSGVAGQVFARQGGAPGCVRAPCFKPAAGVTVTFTRGTQVVRATSNRLGRFRLVLAPGAWTVRAPGLVSVTGGARLVRVPSGRMMPLSLLVARGTR